MYKQYIDPDFTWSNFTLEEQAKVIVAPRSNNLLDTQRVSALQCLAFKNWLPLTLLCEILLLLLLLIVALLSQGAGCLVLRC
jgi:hypothetical protein